MTQDPQPRQFDERAALEDLERLAEKIQISRRQRARAVADFDEFVKTFKQDRDRVAVPVGTAVDLESLYRDPSPAPPAPRAASTPAPPVVPPPANKPAASAVPATATAPTSTAASAVTPPPLPAIPAEEPKASRPLVESSSTSSEDWVLPGAPAAMPPYVEQSLKWVKDHRIAVAAAALVIVVLLLWRPWQSAPPSAPSQPAAASTPAAPPAVQPTPTPAPAPTPAGTSGPPRAINIELTTLRPVWTRVIVDGQRSIERLLPAGQRIPIGADREINIRAGDAGAVQLTVDGKPQGALGRDGQAVTKVLTAKK